MAKKALVAHASDYCIDFIWVAIDFYSKLCSRAIYLYTFLI